jgi:hypothetical protein
MKTRYILFGAVSLIFLITFFFSTIPVPVENIEGIKNQEEFIYGGIYWTSGLYQLTVGNYLGFLAYFGIFIVLQGGIYLIK